MEAVKVGRAAIFGFGSCFALTVAACDSVGSPPESIHVPMATDSAQYVVMRRGYYYNAGIGFTYFNDTDSPVSVPACGGVASLEMKSDSGWVGLPYGLEWACTGGVPPIAIEPRSTRHFVYTFSACDPGHNCAPESVVPVEGTYRLRWDFREGRNFDRSARIVSGTSNEFRLIVQKAPGYVSPFGKFVCGPALDSLASGSVVADIRLKASSGKLIADNSDIQRIEAAGGEVLHRFNIELVRARLSTDALKSLLSPTGIGDYAILVDDPTQYEADVRIFFSDSATDADHAAVKPFLSSPDRVPPPGYSYSLVSDGVIPIISRLSGVKIVRARELSCEFDL